MPWRCEPRDPYAVWVSEVMLQQTRVASVMPYFERFMRRFPDVETLARANIDDVLGAWSGLGYYRRARALHEAARVVVDRFSGRLPATLTELQSLPGVGPYTAAAIGSLAFGLPAAVVDGNVCRVVARLFGIRLPLGDKSMRLEVESHARQMLDCAAPGAFNEAMMDLGALICTPKAPVCLMCPVHAECEAYRTGEQASLPLPAVRRASPRVAGTAFVVACGDHLLLARRRVDGLFGGMWEPPTWLEPPAVARRARVVRSLGAKRWVDCGSVEHILTHRVLAIRVRAASIATRGRVAVDELPSHYDEAAWCTQKEATARGLSVLARKVIASGAARLACGWTVPARRRAG